MPRAAEALALVVLVATSSDCRDAKARRRAAFRVGLAAHLVPFVVLGVLTYRRLRNPEATGVTLPRDWTSVVV